MSLTDPAILDGLAEAQAAFRPEIPAGILPALLPALPVRAGRLAVDIGAGPGRSTRALRRHLGPDWPIVAVEPVQDMRRVLLRDLADDPDLQVLDSPAEALALPPGIAALAAMSDRFPHVDPARALAEAARVLAPGGILAILGHAPAPEGAVAAIRDWLGLDPDDGALPDEGRMAGFADPRRTAARWSLRLDARGLVDLCLADPPVWRLVRRAGLKRLLPELMAVCAGQGLGAMPQEIAMQSRAVTGRKPG